MTYFKQFRYYRHALSGNIDLYVKKIQYRGSKYIKMKVDIVNHAHTGFFQMNYTATIKREDFKMWKDVGIV